MIIFKLFGNFQRMKSRMAANITKRETTRQYMLPDETHNTNLACLQKTKAISK